MSIFSKIKSVVINQNTAAIVAGVATIATISVAKEEDKEMLGVVTLVGWAIGVTAGLTNNKFGTKKISIANSSIFGMAAGAAGYYGVKHSGVFGKVAITVAEETIEVVSEETVA